MIKKGHLTVFLSTIVFIVLSCVKNPLPPEISVWDVRVTDLSAHYNDTTVVLSWSKPSGDFDYYKIYRTTQLDSIGNPDTQSLVSTESRSFVDSSALSFVDIMEPGEGIYYYGIRPAKRFSASLVRQGLLSNVVPCTVGTLVRLTINHNDLYAVSPQCSLFIYDTILKIQ
jgi:hypothetical protein